MNAAVRILTGAEHKLAMAIINMTDEAVVENVARVLRDISAARMQLEAPGSGDQRSKARICEKALLRLTREDGTRIEAALCDVSTGGALIESNEPLRLNERCVVELIGASQSVKAVVRAQRDGVARLAFEDVPPSEMIELHKHLERHYARY